jgi:prepilin-type N-terminal cleavage/methylation domain-containing protein
MGRFVTTANARGFSLLETLVAMSVMTVGVVGLAGLFVAGMTSDQNSHKNTYATLLATQKMDQLRSLVFSFDQNALPITDITTNLAADPPAPAASCPPGCGLTPGGSLSPVSEGVTITDEVNTDGYTDYLDANGNLLGGGPTVLPNTVYIRRWMIQPHPNNPTNTVVLQVRVSPVQGQGTVELGQVTRLPNEARFIAVKTRKFQ